jgi:hypothetical protein
MTGPHKRITGTRRFDEEHQTTTVTHSMDRQAPAKLSGE